MQAVSNSQYDISVFLTSGLSVFRGFSGGRDGGAERARWPVSGRDFDFSGEHLHQALPVVEHEPCGQDLQVSEHPVACSADRSGLLPVLFREVAGGVHREGQEVQDKEHGGKVLLSMAEVPVEVVAEFFGFDFMMPPLSSHGHARFRVGPFAVPLLVYARHRRADGTSKTFWFLW